MDNFLIRLWRYYGNSDRATKTGVLKTFMQKGIKIQLLELSDNLCTKIQTMHKNNCVNFSNNLENDVFYRFNVLNFSELK